MEETTNTNTPDEFYKDIGFFDFLNKGNEIFEKRETISKIFEKHVKQAVEEVLEFVYKDIYNDVNSTPPERDYPKVVQNAFKIPLNLLKENGGSLVYHCVDKSINENNIWQIVVGRRVEDFEVCKTLKVDTYIDRDSSSIILAKANIGCCGTYVAPDQLILSYNNKESTITIYYTKDFPDIDNTIDSILDFSNFKKHIKEADENKEDEDDIKAQEAIKKIQEAVQKAEELIKNNVEK